MFNRARIKLTISYVIVIMTISVFLSSLIYFRATHLLNQEIAGIQRRWVAHQSVVGSPKQGLLHDQFIPQELVQARREIFFHLLVINLVVGGTFFLIGYTLSGMTLAPISQSLEDQQRFVADAAHELKTPITALKTSLEVSLLSKKLPKAARKVLTDNLEDVKSLERLTQMLLTLADRQNLVDHKASSQEAVERAIKHLQPVAKQKKIKIELDKSRDVTVRAHPDALTEVILILLDNAIKYSPPGGKVRLMQRVKKGRWQLMVVDQGPGISISQIAHIFDRFFRGDEARTDQRGYGLGLAVAKHLIQEMNGQIMVASKLGEGAKFVISLKICSQ